METDYPTETYITLINKHLIKSNISDAIEAIKDIIECMPDINSKTKYGSNLLMWASAKGHLEIAEILILNGADVNAKTSQGWTSLMRASYYGHNEIIILLLRAGAEVNIKNSDGKNAVDYAKFEDTKKLIKIKYV